LENPAYLGALTNAILLKFSSPLRGKMKDGGGSIQEITSFDKPVLSEIEVIRMYRLK
jgi:hypothetical protein